MHPPSYHYVHLSMFLITKYLTNYLLTFPTPHPPPILSIKILKFTLVHGRPIPWASHSEFCILRCGLLFGLQSFLFSFLAVVFCLDFDPIYFLLLCGLLFGLQSFLFLFPCRMFFLLFIYFIPWLISSKYPCLIPTNHMSKLSTSHKSPSNF